MPQRVSFCRTGPAQGLHVVLTDEVPRKPSEVPSPPRFRFSYCSESSPRHTTSLGEWPLPPFLTHVCGATLLPSLGTGLEVLAWVSWVEP